MKAKTITQKALLILLLIGFGSASMAQVGIGTTTPDASAILEISSTTKGFLLPRMTNTEMDAINSPAEGLMVYCTDCSPKGIYYYDGTSFVNASTDVALVGTVTGANGDTWMDRDLGASRVAQDAFDFEAHGNLYQWGRGNDGHEQINWTAPGVGTAVNGTTTTQFADANTNSNSDFVYGHNVWTTLANTDDGQGGVASANLWDTGVNNPCPSGFRVPTNTELTTELDALGFGTSLTVEQAHAGPLKLVGQGFRWGDTTDPTRGGIIVPQGNGGIASAFYWTSTFSGTDQARRVRLRPAAAAQPRSYDVEERTLGMSVRCIQDNN